MYNLWDDYKELKIAIKLIYILLVLGKKELHFLAYYLF